ncbi:MAG TPA: CpaF family protein [Thermodesulfovibrionales bacterium]|nr:CpaF family protein [Thermodesulfovibrionales bacterium]
MAQTEKKLSKLDIYQGLKAKIHKKLIELMDFSNINLMDRDVLKHEIGAAVESLIEKEGIPLSQAEKESLIVDIQHETFGLGPLEPLLADPDISDILVNRYNQIFVEKAGKLHKADVLFRDDNHVLQIIDRIVSKVGRRVDESSPYVDARLPDGSRVNAIIPPLAIDGPVLSIRRFGVDPLKMTDILAFGTLTQNMAMIIEACVNTRLNVLISGGSGSGKTTLLNILSEFISDDERIITIEDSAELQMKQEHVVRLESRAPNIEGKGAVSQRDLVRNALRMRPDRIILGEVRGGEALDMLQAMNTGHDGSLSTIHANSSRDAMARLETMVLMAGLDLPERAIREQISSAIHVVIQLARFSDGSRKIIGVAEITGMEGNTIVMQDIFVFRRKGIGPDGRIIGEFVPTGVRPRFIEKFGVSGITVPAHIFEAIQ